MLSVAEWDEAVAGAVQHQRRGSYLWHNGPRVIADVHPEERKGSAGSGGHPFESRHPCAGSVGLSVAPQCWGEMFQGIA